MSDTDGSAEAAVVHRDCCGGTSTMQPDGVGTDGDGVRWRCPRCGVVVVVYPAIAAWLTPKADDG